MQRTVLKTVIAAIAAVSALVALAAPAAADTPVNSSYLAGYQTSQVGISRATASLLAPTVTCDPTITQGVAFGIGNEPTPGHLSMLAGVRVVCSDGSAQIFGYAFGTSTHQVQLGGIAAGDKFSLTILQTQRRVTIIAADLTAGGSFSVSGSPVPDNTLTFGAFPIESGVTPLPVPQFDTVTISRPVLENTGLAAWSPTRINRRSGTTTQIRTGAFTAAGNFRVFYQAS